MEKSPRPTEHQKWIETAQNEQNTIDLTLEMLQPHVDSANVILEKLYQENREQVIPFAGMAVRTLNQNWHYHNHAFMVTGQWYAPSVENTLDTMNIHQEREQAFAAASSRGFGFSMIENDTGGQTPRIGLSFGMRPLEIKLTTFEGAITPLAFANPNEINMTYLRPNNSDIVSASEQEIKETLGEIDEQLCHYLEASDARFYRQKSKKQEAFLRSMVDAAYDVLPSTESSDVLYLQDGQPDRFYVHDKSKDDHIECIYVGDSEMHIEGMVVGVTCIDLINTQGTRTRYRTPEELDTARDGLCFVVKARSIRTPQMNFPSPESDIYIPYRALNVDDLTLI